MPKKIETYVGPMNSRKSGELINQLQKESIAGRHVIAFKPEIDTRTNTYIASRDGEQYHAIPVANSHDLLQKVEQITSAVNQYHKRHKHRQEKFIIGIDEAQFFDNDLPEVVDFIANELNIKVYLAGLPRDFRGEPFGPMAELLARSRKIHTLHAICTHKEGDGTTCGHKATETYRSINGQPANYDDPVILVGDQDEGYEARCLKHHIVPGKPQKFPK